MEIGRVLEGGPSVECNGERAREIERERQREENWKGERQMRGMERKESNLEVAREEKTRSVAEKKIGGVRVSFGVASRVVVVSDRAFPTREILSRDTSVPRFNFLRGLISPLIHLSPLP